MTTIQALTIVESPKVMKNIRLRSRHNGFTIIELLVVVTIIVVLLALLAPTMDKAVQESFLARCGANLHASSLALALYMPDHAYRYPSIHRFGTLMGDAGDGYLATPITRRPLNAYLGYTSDGGRVSVAECPADLGDVAFPTPSAYETFGTSYLSAYEGDRVGRSLYTVMMVFGQIDAYGSYVPTPGYKHSKLNPLHTKMVLADWPWWGNRWTESEMTRWHRPQDPRRRINTLFADGHAQLMLWDEDRIDGVPVATPHDRSWKWW